MNPEAVTIDCSWKIENVDAVRTKILWKEQLSELSEETSIENCFNMSQSNPDSGPCTLKIILKNNRKFAALQILSEVPMIEVHGQYEEYLMTVRGELLEEVEGTSLYECRIDLKKMQSEIILKFCKLKEATTVWVYGISAVTVEATPSMRSLSGQSAGANHLLSSIMQGFNQDGKNVDSIEMIIDKKIKEMEERMMARIEERLGRLEKRMEEDNSKMISMLLDLKTSNK
ncbi:uncharacterized protein LOC124192277 [Daphnia pulex]|uniref:uncharacterized protein LOC124192277 n=1 Tax=Daphnia pulex TaxID=6669 RepID=UPI001EDF1888|nr:uncharacterized protein LOC124192277 [Daphnia pulex]XP_046441449.1 uncharacterized protein LOC124192277 [Daphnia pulex]XP_046441450.1 uncharacterized protein LOC124192277 [Daphnia pulex]